MRNFVSLSVFLSPCFTSAWVVPSTKPHAYRHSNHHQLFSSPTTQTPTLDGVPIRQDITATSNLIVVKVKDTLTATSGGILLPDQSQERPTEGLVLAAGPGKIHPLTGVRITNPITSGMSVL